MGFLRQHTYFAQHLTTASKDLDDLQDGSSIKPQFRSEAHVHAVFAC